MDKIMTKDDLKKLIQETIQETIKEEASMAVSDLEMIGHMHEHLKELIKDDSELEDWVKAKLTMACANLISVFKYLNHQSHGGTDQAAINTDAGMTSGEESLDEKVNKWIQKAVHPSKKGMFTGKTVADLKTMLAAVKKQAAKYKEKGEKVPHALRTKESQLVFAIRAKTKGLKEDDTQMGIYTPNPNAAQYLSRVRTVKTGTGSKITTKGVKQPHTKK
jgi:hypothetical protein